MIHLRNQHRGPRSVSSEIKLEIIRDSHRHLKTRSIIIRPISSIHFLQALIAESEPNRDVLVGAVDLCRLYAQPQDGLPMISQLLAWTEYPAVILPLTHLSLMHLLNPAVHFDESILPFDLVDLAKNLKNSRPDPLQFRCFRYLSHISPYVDASQEIDAFLMPLISQKLSWQQASRCALIIGHCWQCISENSPEASRYQKWLINQMRHHPHPRVIQESTWALARVYQRWDADMIATFVMRINHIQRSVLSRYVNLQIAE
eukprot:TRINITY_DN5848_c0_g1_i3.p1 TRINITY_DN5848_c0_g1~~TRINITY_DN5848_c0_g1_i3.p1  ORF type:complete len:259 (+),score=62.93 TRINITY_DN5848_c0_g1_i3:373-1149(+)